ncbi:hypothetical protein ACNKHK_27285 [Shigella flexneri]
MLESLTHMQTAGNVGSEIIVQKTFALVAVRFKIALLFPSARKAAVRYIVG